jgi:hypothetical protein
MLGTTGYLKAEEPALRNKLSKAGFMGFCTIMMALATRSYLAAEGRL